MLGTSEVQAPNREGCHPLLWLNALGIPARAKYLFASSRKDVAKMGEERLESVVCS